MIVCFHLAAFLTNEYCFTPEWQRHVRDIAREVVECMAHVGALLSRVSRKFAAVIKCVTHKITVHFALFFVRVQMANLCFWKQDFLPEIGA